MNDFPVIRGVKLLHHPNKDQYEVPIASFDAHLAPDIVARDAVLTRTRTGLHQVALRRKQSIGPMITVRQGAFRDKIIERALEAIAEVSAHG